MDAYSPLEHAVSWALRRVFHGPIEPVGNSVLLSVEDLLLRRQMAKG